jgi:hypothetical protein
MTNMTPNSSLNKYMRRIIWFDEHELKQNKPWKVIVSLGNKTLLIWIKNIRQKISTYTIK